jgi:hypothetical protein
MVKEAVEHFEKKGLKINKLRGKFGRADETTDEDRAVRDAFWQSMGFSVNQREIKAGREDLKLEGIKTHRVTEREHMLEIENEYLRELVQQQKQQIKYLQSLKEKSLFKPVINAIKKLTSWSQSKLTWKDTSGDTPLVPFL